MRSLLAVYSGRRSRRSRAALRGESWFTSPPSRSFTVCTRQALSGEAERQKIRKRKIQRQSESESEIIGERERDEKEEGGGWPLNIISKDMADEKVQNEYSWLQRDPKTGLRGREAGCVFCLHPWKCVSRIGLPFVSHLLSHSMCPRRSALLARAPLSIPLNSIIGNDILLCATNQHDQSL